MLTEETSGLDLDEEYEIPDFDVCEICNDDGDCLDNKNHPDYKYDPWDDLTYLLCWGYIRRRDAKKKEVDTMNKEGSNLKIKDVIDYKVNKGKTLFHYINEDKSIAELVAYLTKHKIQACAVTKGVSDDGMFEDIEGEIGWGEIVRNIVNIMNDPVKKHMKSPNHTMFDSESLIKTNRVISKKRIFYIKNNDKKYYATITPDNLLSFYSEIVEPFSYLREIEMILKAILIKYDVKIPENPTIFDYNKAFFNRDFFSTLPYNLPRKPLAKNLAAIIEIRNAFFHHRVKEIDTELLKDTWKELKSISNEVYKK